MKLRFLSLLATPALFVSLADSSRAATYATAVLADNPIAYWQLGADATDSSTFGRAPGVVDGTTGSVTFGQPSLVFGEAGAVALAGAAAGQRRIVIPGFEKLGATGISTEYWVNVTAYPTNCCDNLVGDGESGGDFFMMNYLIGPGQGDTGAIRPHYFGSSTTALTTTNPNVLALNTTYHVVTTWDRTAGTGNVYFNGSLVLSGAVTGGAVNTNNQIFIGRDGREDRPSNFIIDEVALYDYALTPAQIQNHYNLGIGIPEPGSVSLLGIAVLGTLLRRRR